MPASRPDYCGRRDDWRLQDGRILTATTPTSGMQLVPNTIVMSLFPIPFLMQGITFPSQELPMQDKSDQTKERLH